MDVNSFIDYHWMIEASKNVDGHWFSQYYHKDRGGLLRAGPVWDWDMAFGNLRYLRSQETNGWRSDQVNGSYYSWYTRMFEDEEFLQEYLGRWSELRATVFSTTNIHGLIDRIAHEIRPAAVRSIQRWFPPPAGGKDSDREPGRRYEKEVRQLKDWIRDRLSWIDSQEYPRPIVHVGTADQRGLAQVSMACLRGRIYYSTNGIDPRARGAAIANGALDLNTVAPSQ